MPFRFLEHDDSIIVDNNEQFIAGFQTQGFASLARDNDLVSPR
jgi:hypothetical protein